MAQARHIGKIVVRRRLVGGDPVQSDGTYLVTGGTGGIGSKLARRLVELGARHIALAGRSELGEYSDMTAELTALGAEVRVLQADVSVRSDVERLIGEIDETMAPLCGIVHASGVNTDALLHEQTWTSFRDVLAPKLAGAWHLHELTRHRALTMFVVVSSASAVLGASAQANYAAANSFLDGLAAWRKADTGVGVSIAWGPWDRVGMTARLDDHDIARLRRRGLVAMPADVAVDSFAQVIGSRDRAAEPAHVVVIDLDPATAEDRPFLSRIRRPAVSQASAPHALLDTWIDGVPGMWRAAVSGFVVEEAIKVLGLPSGSTIGPRQPFHELGLDSLMAVELRNAIGAAVGRPQPATLLFDHPTTEALVEHLLDVVRAAEESRRPHDANVRAVGADPAGGVRLGGRDADVRRVVDLTEAEAEALLLTELDEIGGGT